jgi:hypothetical protein
MDPKIGELHCPAGFPSEMHRGLKMKTVQVT